MSHFRPDIEARMVQLLELYPERRSALIPLYHLAQEQDGWLTPEAIEELAAMVGITAAEVRGTATFYDMLHTEPVGTYLIGICTNIACLIGGAEELLSHAEGTLGIRAGGTTPDGMFTLEDTECLADCDRVPCVTVNHRYVGAQTPESFEQLLGELRDGSRGAEIPPHGTLVRVPRTVGLRADRQQVVRERAADEEARSARAAASESGSGG